MSMTTDNTCKECEKDRCLNKNCGLEDDEAFCNRCHGHPDEKKECACPFTPHECHAEHDCCPKPESTRFKCTASGCEGCESCQPPTQEGWEERFDSKRNELWCADALTEEPVYFGYRRIVKVGNDTEVVTITDWGHIKAFIRQEKAESQEEGYSKAIEDAREAVKSGRPVGGGGEFYSGTGAVFNQGWEEAHEKVLSTLDKLKKKV